MAKHFIFLLTLITLSRTNARPPEDSKEVIQKSFYEENKPSLILTPAGFENSDFKNVKEIKTDIVPEIAHELGMDKANDFIGKERMKRDVGTTKRPFIRINLSKTNDSSAILFSGENNYGTNKRTRRGTKRVVNQFLHEEKNSLTNQNNNNNYNNNNSGSHKHYSCKITNKNRSGYDIMYFEFVKNMQNNYAMVNSSVIHGYYNDITVTNRNNSNNGVRMDNKVTETVTKRVIKLDECVIGSVRCPSGMVKKGSVCVPAPNDLPVDYEDYSFD